MAPVVRVDGVVVVEGGEEHPHALRRLQAGLPGEVIAASAAPPDGATRIALRTTAERPEGSFAITATNGGAPAIVIEGGPFSGVIYGVEQLVKRQVSDGVVQAETVEQAPGLMSQRNE